MSVPVPLLQFLRYHTEGSDVAKKAVLTINRRGKRVWWVGFERGEELVRDALGAETGDNCRLDRAVILRGARF